MQQLKFFYEEYQEIHTEHVSSPTFSTSISKSSLHSGLNNAEFGNLLMHAACEQKLKDQEQASIYNNVLSKQDCDLISAKIRETERLRENHIPELLKDYNFTKRKL